MGSNVETKKLSIDEMTVEQLREALEKKMVQEKVKENKEEKNEKNENCDGIFLDDTSRL